MTGEAMSNRWSGKHGITEDLFVCFLFVFCLFVFLFVCVFCLYAFACFFVRSFIHLTSCMFLLFWTISLIGGVCVYT